MSFMDISDPSRDHGRETQPLLIDKKFKVYEILWDIDNFYFQCCQENWEIRSPEVDGPQETKLMLILRPTPNEDDTYSFLVKRSQSDVGPETVWVNFNMDVGGTYILCKYVQTNKLCSLNKGDECEMTFTALDYLFGNTKIYKYPDNLFIRCEMIIYIHDESAEFEECTDVGIRSLSDDMLALYESSRDYDIELKIGNVLLRAHKSILSARCECIRDLIVDFNEDDKFLDFSDNNFVVDVDAVKRVFAFLYTGDLKHALEKPSLYIHKLAMKLDIQEITKYYAYEALFFTSAVHTQEFIVNWSIQDFNSVLENNKRLLSPVFTDCNSSRTWKLHFYPRGNEDENYVDIFVQTNEEIISNVWLEISAVKEDGSLTLINMLRCRGDGCKMFEFKEVACRNWIKSRAFRNVLNMSIKLKLSSGCYISEIKKHHFMSIFKKYTEPSYEMLSRDMRKLLLCGKFHDSVLVAESAALNVHKCIMAARCRTVYDMLMSRGRGCHLVIRDMRYDVLRVVLTYLYCGSILDIEEKDKLAEVCKAAKYFKLTLLEEGCSKLLLDHFIRSLDLINNLKKDY